MQEPAIIQRCRNGDREARRELYLRTVDRVYRLLLRMTRNADDASELTQDTYVRAFTRIHQFRGDSSIETWLYRIASNEALQFLRRAGAERARLDQRGGPRRLHETADESHDVRIDVAAALERLDAADRLVLLLRYDQGLDYRAIAEVLDCPEGTVASRLNRARSRMEQALAAGYDESEETGDGRHPTMGSSRTAEGGTRSPMSASERPSQIAAQRSEVEP